MTNEITLSKARVLEATRMVNESKKHAAFYKLKRNRLNGLSFDKRNLSSTAR